MTVILTIKSLLPPFQRRCKIQYGLERPSTTKLVSLLHCLASKTRHIAKSHSFVRSFHCYETICRRLAAIVGSGLVGFQAVFLSEYTLPNSEHEKHVFTDVQQSYRDWVQRYFVRQRPQSPGFQVQDITTKSQSSDDES